MKTISIIPTYKCNGHCGYCYLGNNIYDVQIINIDKLDKQLKELISYYRDNVRIDIFGGEVTLLSEAFIDELLSACMHYTNAISIISNFSDFKRVQSLIERGVGVAISLNKERGKLNDIAIDNINKLSQKHKKQLTVSVVCLPSILKIPPEHLLNYFDQLNVGAVDIIQYYPAINARKNYTISNKQFENYIINLIESYRANKHTFLLVNDHKWDRNYDCAMGSNIFITPYNQYATVAYDDNGFEYFKIFKSLRDYQNACILEQKNRLGTCACCQWYSKCLAEHIKPHQKHDTCCGLPRLCQYIYDHHN